MAEERKQFKVGDKVRVVLRNEEEEEPLMTAEYTMEGPDKQKLLSEKWRDPKLRAFHEPPKEKAPAGVKEGLEVAKFLWDIIKDNKPSAKGVGTTTSVLIKGTNGLDYTGAKNSQSQTFIFEVHDATFPSVKFITVKFRLEGTYLATPAKGDIPFGHYLPSVYFNITECWATWPTWVEASAEVTPPSDFGTPDNRQPEIRVYAKFHWGWIGSANNNTCGFIANGVRGMSARGWE